MRSDASILVQLLGLHYDAPPTILDTTGGGQRMWRGCRYQPSTTFDRRPLPGIDVVGEWAQMPELLSTKFQAAVWDPPHQTDGGVHALGGGWAHAYGTAAEDVLRRPDITHLYAGFLQAARAVLVPDGTLLCKIADQTHSGVQHLQAVDFVIACRAAGWTVCEMVPKMRRPGPMDPKWRRQYHVRKAWSYWICAHPGPRCPAVGVRLLRLCEGPECGREFRAKRSDARTCSGACRERLRYRRNLTVIRSATPAASVRFGA